MKVQYIADDGEVFDTAACIRHERTPDVRLLKLIEEECPTTFCDDVGGNVIEDFNVRSFIIDNYSMIKSIMEDLHPHPVL